MTPKQKAQADREDYIATLEAQVRRLTEERDTARRDLQEQLAIQRLEAEVIQSLEAALAAKDDALALFVTAVAERYGAEAPPLYLIRAYDAALAARTALGATKPCPACAALHGLHVGAEAPEAGNG